MEGLGSLDCNLSMGKLGILQHVCSEDRPYCGRSAQAQQDVDLLQSKSYAPQTCCNILLETRLPPQACQAYLGRRQSFAREDREKSKW